MMQFTVFILIAIVMVLCALALVLPIFFKNPKDNVSNDNANSTRQGNLDAVQERLDNLRAGISAKEIDTNIADEYEQEISSQLLLDLEHDEVSWATGRWHIAGIALVVLLVAGVAPLLYSILGNPAMVASPANMTEMLNRLELRVAKSPNDIESILWLARILSAQNRISDASAYYTRAYQLAGDTPEILAEQINMLLQSDIDDATISKMLRSGLQQSAQHPMLLWLAGIHAENQNDIPQALSYWQRAYDNLSDDSAQQQLVVKKIAQVKSRLSTQDSSSSNMNAESVPEQPPAPLKTEIAGNDAGVSVTVSLSETVSVAPETTLFIFAKAVGEGPKMPLAVYRSRAKDLPLTIRLDDSLAMTSALKMSDFAIYDITARLSLAGGVSASSGDWLATVKARSGDDITLIIDQQIP